jgi:predicted nucleic acid-binding protein
VTRYLLDTNVISEVRKPKPHGGVLGWIEGLREDQLYIAAVMIGELQRGVEQTRSLDKPKALAIESWLDQLETTFTEFRRRVHGPMRSTTFGC